MPSYGKNKFKESNVSYLGKDFTALKSSLVNYAKSYFPNTYRDFNETSPGMMLIEMNAYVGDVLSFYIDQQYREMLLPLAEERRNVINMAKMFGYKVKPIIPSHVELTFKQNLSVDSSDSSKVDYSTGGIFDSGIEVKGTNSNVIFETLDVVDFQVSQSNDTTTPSGFDSSTGLANGYTLQRKVKAISGKTKTSTFTVGAPEKFKKITLSSTNIVDIISCVDSNGNNWYEVDFLAQDKVPIPLHYTNDSSRASAYSNALDGTISNNAAPYSLTYIKTNKRFTRETNIDNTTSLVFGNGVLRDGKDGSIDQGYIDMEQIGITIPGQTNDLNEAINPLLGDEYSTLGETPNNTTLTITYRVGGGIASNIAANDLNQIQNASTMNGSATGVTKDDLTVVNIYPARGGRDEETVDEIKERTKAFFSTQNRCVTKEDYEARVMNIPSKFGNVAKVYVARSGDTGGDPEYSNIFQNNLGTLETMHSNVSSELVNFRDRIQESIMNNDLDASDLQSFNIILNNFDEMITPIGLLNEYSDLTTFDLSTINVYVLGYDINRNLVGNPMISYQTVTDNVPKTLMMNVKNYLENFKILTDSVNLIDGYIVNFGVFFDVVANKDADKKQVKLRCIDKIKEYFEIQKMQFNQPIYKSQLEYELMDIVGVRAVNHVTITQQTDYHEYANGESLNNPTYTYSFDTEIDPNGDGINEGGYTSSQNGTAGYGYAYDFEDALRDGIIRPPEPSTPAVFELKNPNQNIQGRVR